MRIKMKEFIDLVSDQIGSDMRSLSHEEWYPGHDAERSESRIKTLKERISALRDIRTRIEELMSVDF